MLSVEQAAQLLGVSSSRVRALIKSGRLSAVKNGRSWILREEDVLQRLSEHPHPGRPQSASRTLACANEQSADEDRIAEAHALYEGCRELFRLRPTSVMLQEAHSQEEASFYMAVADFFLQQKQAQLIAEGVY